MISFKIDEIKKQILETKNFTELHYLLGGREFSVYLPTKYPQNKNEIDTIYREIQSSSELENIKGIFYSRLKIFDDLNPPNRNYFINPLDDLYSSLARYHIALSKIASLNERIISVRGDYNISFDNLQSYSIDLLEMINQTEVRNLRFQMMD